MTQAGAPAFDPELFARLHADHHLRWGMPLTYRDRTGSTNDDALAAARTGAPQGSLFVADDQSEGRGRRGRSWYGTPGQSLMFSLLLRPEAGEELTPALTLAVGLALRAALAPLSSAQLAIKWPNDVVAAGLKLGGILCEGQLEQDRIDAVVIGAGVNLLQARFPPELEALATSLLRLAPRARPLPARELLLVSILEALEPRVRACMQHGFAPLLDEFRAHDALAGHAVRVEGTSLSGVARGVDSEGALLVESEGQRVAVRTGTVRLGSEP